MSPAWSLLLAMTCLPCNAASTAYDASLGMIYANGVVYIVDALGDLIALDAMSGAPVTVKPTIAEGVDNPGGVNSAGVTIARNTVYVPARSHVVAYRLP